MAVFDAFISYSHAADGKLAPAIEAGLQRFARRPFQRRALRVFRDETGLSLNPHLWGGIQAALDQSEWFVLLASPDAANSQWVAREIERWLDKKAIDHLLIVVTDGELAFEDDGRVDAARTTCLAAPMLAALRDEPRWLDLRWARDENQLDLRNGRFRAAIADLAAPMHGVAKDDLEGEDVRQQRRARRLAAAGIVAVALLAIASTVAAVVAVDRGRQAAAERDQAETERNRAETERERAEAERERAETESNRANTEAQRALARGLITQAAALTGVSFETSLLLAVEAYRRDPSADTEDALLNSLEAARVITSSDTQLPPDIVDLEPSPDRTTLYLATSSGEVQAYDATTLTARGAPLLSGVSDLRFLEVSGDGSRLALITSRDVQVVDVSGSTANVVGGAQTGSELAYAALNADGSLLAVGPQVQGVVQVFDVASQMQITQIEVDGPSGMPVFLRDGRLAVQGFTGTELSIYRLEGGAAILDRSATLPVQGAALELSSDGSKLLVIGLDNNGTMLIDSATLEPATPVISTRGVNTRDLFFDASGRRVGWSNGDDSVTIFDTADGREVLAFTGLSGDLTITQFIGEDSLVSVSRSTGRVVAWTLGGRSSIGTYEPVGGEVSNVVIADGGKLVASIGSSVVIASVDRPTAASVSRAFGPETSFIAALDVSETADLAAVFVTDVDGNGQETDHRVHLVGSTDLTDRAVVELGDQYVGDVAFSPDGARLAVAGYDGRLLIIDTMTGRPARQPIVVDETDCCLRTLAWNADGSRLHVGGRSGVLYTFDTSTWQRVGEHSLTPDFSLTRAALVPDDDQIVVPSEGGVVFLLDASSGAPIGEPFRGDGAEPEAATLPLIGSTLQAAVLAGDGTQLAAMTGDGRLLLWDVETRRPIGPPLGGHDSSSAIAVESQRSLITGGSEGALIRWDLDPASWVSRACELAGRNLTRQEWERYVGDEYAATCEQWPLDEG